MKKSFFQINMELDTIFQDLENYCIQNDTDEIPEELIQSLTIAQEQQSEKLADYKSYINYLNGNISGIDEQIKDLQNAKKRFKTRIDRLKSVALETVNRFGEDNKSGNKFIETLTGKITVTKSKSVEIIDEQLIHNDFKTEVVSIKINKKEILKFLKDGIIVQGCQLKETESIRGL